MVDSRETPVLHQRSRGIGAEVVGFDAAVAVWPDLARECGLHASLPWAKTAWKLAGGRAVPERCLVARAADDGRPLGVIAAGLFAEPAEHLYDPYAQVVERAAAGLGPREDWLPVLIAGAPSGYASAFAIDDRLTAEHKVEVVRRLMDELATLGRALGARSVYVPFLTAPSSELARRAGAGSTPPVLAGGEAVLPIRWSSFDDYVTWLPQSRRRTVRKDVKAFAESGCTVRTEPLTSVGDELAPLLYQLMRRYEDDATPERAASMLAAYQAHLGAASVLFVARRHDGAPVGFSLLFEWEGMLYARLCGFDYALATGSAEYFELLFHQPIRIAIERGVRLLHLGVGAMRPKLLRGARLSALWSLLVPIDQRPRAWNAAIARVSSDRQVEWLERWGALAVETSGWEASGT